MNRDEYLLIIQVRTGFSWRTHGLIVRRSPRVCAPWWRAVGAGLRLVLGLEAGEEER